MFDSPILQHPAGDARTSDGPAREADFSRLIRSAPSTPVAVAPSITKDGRDPGVGQRPRNRSPRPIARHGSLIRRRSSNGTATTAPLSTRQRRRRWPTRRVSSPCLTELIQSVINPSCRKVGSVSCRGETKKYTTGTRGTTSPLTSPSASRVEKAKVKDNKTDLLFQCQEAEVHFRSPHGMRLDHLPVGRVRCP